MTNRTRAVRGPLAVLAAAFVLLAVLAGPAPAASAAPTKGPGEYSPPEWLPLRHDVDGGEIEVGCTHESHGSPRGYECGGHHSYWAIDFIADRGTPIYAAGKGFAVNATGQRGATGYGNVVRIDHGGGVQSLYAHMEQVLVPPEGAWVDQDTVIGIVGSTGTSSAPHLHFERRINANDTGSYEQVDPGPLKACILARVVAFPQIRDQPTWDHVSWGAFTVFSDGTSCEVPAAVPAEAVKTNATAAALGEKLPSGWLILALADIGSIGSR